MRKMDRAPDPGDGGSPHSASPHKTPRITPGGVRERCIRPIHSARVRVYSVCVCVFIKLHITAQSGLVILAILLCVCLCCHPIYSGRQIFGRTSRGHTGGRSHRIFPPSFCGACLNFLSREGFSRPFPSSTVKSNFAFPQINRSPFVGHFLCFTLVRQNPSSCD